MEKVIISGANGFVGSALVKEMVKNKIKVIALDLEGHKNNIIEDELVEFIPFSMEFADKLVDKVVEQDIDVFYHFAWAGSAGEGRANTNLQLANVQWTIDCLRVAKKIGCKRFVNAGSIMEYETMDAAFTQGNKPGLGYIYGSGKLVAHTMCKSVAADIGIELVWAMITNAYGAGEESPRFVNTTIRKILHDEPLQFTAGTQNYDFVYISDVAKAFYLIGKNGKPFCDYLIGSSQAKPLREFILEMKESLAPDKEFIFGDVPFTGTVLPLSQFDCFRTEEDTGFKAEISFYEGVRKTMKWIKERESK